MKSGINVGGYSNAMGHWQNRLTRPPVFKTPVAAWPGTTVVTGSGTGLVSAPLPRITVANDTIIVSLALTGTTSSLDVQTLTGPGKPTAGLGGGGATVVPSPAFRGETIRTFNGGVAAGYTTINLKPASGTTGFVAIVWVISNGSPATVHDELWSNNGNTPTSSISNTTVGGLNSPNQTHVSTTVARAALTVTLPPNYVTNVQAANLGSGIYVHSFTAVIPGHSPAFPGYGWRGTTSGNNVVGLRDSWLATT